MKLSDIAVKLGCRLDGDPSAEISGVAGLEHAAAGQLTFLANRHYFPLLRSTKASAIFVEDNVRIERAPGLAPLAALRSSNPYLDFARAIELFYTPPAYAPGIHPSAVIAETARIAAGAHIGPYCFVDEEVTIGANAVLHSFVTIYRGVTIGDNFFAHAHSIVREHCRVGNSVLLQNGVVIGADGLGFAKQKDGSWYKIQQSGPAILEDDVEVQANACVDRATVGETRIGRGAKIDDLVLIGHACEVGAYAMLCGQVGLAGSTVIGERAILAGQVGTAGHLTIGADAVITAKSGVPSDVPDKAMYSGYPAVENRQWLRSSAVIRRLPELQRKISELEKEVADIKRTARLF
jgi:UDP-3-O-[3-hydroxymyristoyl] glucosamine N-acyltransferase